MAGPRTTPGRVTVRVERTTDTTVVVRATGEIDLATAEPLRDALAVAADPTVRLLVCDLTAVSFLACSGVGMLVAARSTLAERGAELEVVASHPSVLRVFAVTGLSDLLVLRTALRAVPG